MNRELHKKILNSFNSNYQSLVLECPVFSIGLHLCYGYDYSDKLNNTISVVKNRYGRNESLSQFIELEITPSNYSTNDDNPQMLLLIDIYHKSIAAQLLEVDKTMVLNSWLAIESLPEIKSTDYSLLRINIHTPTKTNNFVIPANIDDFAIGHVFYSLK